MRSSRLRPIEVAALLIFTSILVVAGAQLGFHVFMPVLAAEIVWALFGVYLVACITLDNR